MQTSKISVRISDPNLQKEYLEKLLKTMDFNTAETSKVPIVKQKDNNKEQIVQYVSAHWNEC